MVELYPANTYYGIGQVFKEYSGFPQWIPLPVTVQHGWTTMTNPHDARTDAPENWFWSRDIEALHRKDFPTIRSRTVGAPFLYFLKNVGYQPLPEEQRAGSIVFPSHSSVFIDMRCDFDSYAAQLASLPAQYHPITICMYYLDMDKGRHQPFVDQGFEIVSNGKMHDIAFLYNYVKHTSGKLYAFSNQMTSALLFASVMGLESFYHGPQFSVDNREPELLGLDLTKYNRDWEEKYQHIFHFPEHDLQTQRECAQELLGKCDILPPDEMSQILWRLLFTPTYLWASLRKYLWLDRIYLKARKTIRDLRNSSA